LLLLLKLLLLMQLLLQQQLLLLKLLLQLLLLLLKLLLLSLLLLQLQLQQLLLLLLLLLLLDAIVQGLRPELFKAELVAHLAPTHCPHSTALLALVKHARWLLAPRRRAACAPPTDCAHGGSGGHVKAALWGARHGPAIRGSQAAGSASVKGGLLLQPRSSSSCCSLVSACQPPRHC